jgi:N-dimethylarginine dimethylaminohydrolase
MCPPTYFAVRYAINPWMRPERPVDTARAVRQWRRLHDRIEELGHRVDVMAPHPDLPDLVFAANGGIVIGPRALLPRFRHPERAGETRQFGAALRALGVDDIRTAQYVNEGEGDFLLVGDRILAGTGPRSASAAVDEVAEFFGVPTVPLGLVDPRFYHLDTALARLDADVVAYWPGAFDVPSRGVLHDLFPDALLATEADAAELALNLVSDGSTVLMAPGRTAFAAAIADRGFRIEYVPTDELRKAGGGAKCCVLEYHAARLTPAR